jgi:hypothetical protein
MSSLVLPRYYKSTSALIEYLGTISDATEIVSVNDTDDYRELIASVQVATHASKDELPKINARPHASNMTQVC